MKLRAKRVDDDGVAIGAGGERIVLVDEISGLRSRRESRRLISLAGPVSMARPSAFHLSRPPSSTEAFSKPSDCSIHQNRVAHIGGADRIEHHVAVCRYAVAAERSFELRNSWHHEAKLGAGIGELALQIQKIRARNMSGLESVLSGHGDIGNAAAFGRGFEIGRAVEQAKIGLIEDAGEFRGRDQPVAL